jgi:hypothetical protein
MSNFRLCGDMKKRRWKVLEKRREAETSGARARNGGKVAKDCVCPISGCSRESKSRLAKAACVEPCAEMGGETCALLWCEAEVFKKDQEGTSTSRPEGFWEFIG